MSDAPETPATRDGCPLAWRDQRRNLVLFACCTGLQYLSAPVGYVGVTQASLCHELGSSDAVANLPETAYQAMTFAPVVLAWLVPYIAWLKRNLVSCYAVAALSQGAAALLLAGPFSAELKVGAVIVQAGLQGVAVPSAIAFLWELIGRGSATSRRGLALSLAFGLGPALAIAGSLGSQLLLKGSLDLFGQRVALSGLDFPRNFAVLYGCTAPLMLLAAILSTQFVVPPPEQDAIREPFAKSVFGGMAQFAKNRLLLTATIVTILVYTGNTITANLNLYTKELFGESPMLHAGNQNAWRFGFKMGTGLLLGWLLNRTNPRAGLLVTSTIFLAAVIGAVFASAGTYLLVFGLFGAGELVGVYAPNYILSASRPEEMRRNLAYVTMMMVPAAPAGYLFGLIVDTVKANKWTALGMSPPVLGFRLSFILCALMMLTGIVIAVTRLPKHPAAQSPGAGGEPRV